MLRVGKGAHGDTNTGKSTAALHEGAGGETGGCSPERARAFTTGGCSPERARSFTVCVGKGAHGDTDAGKTPVAPYERAGFEPIAASATGAASAAGSILEQNKSDLLGKQATSVAFGGSSDSTASEPSADTPAAVDDDVDAPSGDEGALFGDNVPPAPKRIYRQRTAERLKFMHSQHMLAHEGATRLNQRLARGEYGDQGCSVTPDDIAEWCDGCGFSGTERGSLSHVHSRARHDSPLHTWSWDIFELPKECCKNRDGIKYVFGAICRASGHKFFYYAKRKTSTECLSFMKALKRFVDKTAPFTAKKYGLTELPKIVVLGQDNESSSKTSFGIRGTVVETWLKANDISRDLTGADNHRNGSAEVMWKVMAQQCGASLATAGMRTEWYVDAIAHWVFTTNHSTGSDANRLSRHSSPAETCGLPDRSREKRRFGSSCWYHVDGTLNMMGLQHQKQKSVRKGARGVLLGWDDEVAGYKAVLLVSKKILTSWHWHVPKSGLASTRNFVKSVRGSIHCLDQRKVRLANLHQDGFAAWVAFDGASRTTRCTFRSPDG